MADEMLLKNIGVRISKRRKHLNLTQEQVAEKMGVSIQMISNLELGKKAIRPENLIKISSVLDISCDYILTGKMNDSDTNTFIDRISMLREEDYKMIEMLVEYCLSKNWIKNIIDTKKPIREG